ncbi:hypothetical protein [Streptomyces griseorubiginosus]|uniref:hypothetical protein n=1 Tax=Streptomyces griseorubiginosus TaxID=67304 RepID=UPI002E81E1E8|nr:hypothetical protein [Streptomyces griseorubiginosus]WUB58867.1 hypothetical protein OG942_43630 [Streptomyces griseorubiginosus]
MSAPPRRADCTTVGTMLRRPALLIPLVLLAATACVSVRDDGRPARPPAAPATTAAAPAPASVAPPSQAPAREALVRTDDGRPRGRKHAKPAPKSPVRRAAPPEAAAPPPRPRAVRPAPAMPRRPAAPAPRERPRATSPAASYDMRTLCRAAARNGVGQNIVDLCRSTYG